MIFLVTTRAGRHTVDEYLASEGLPERDVLSSMTYDELRGRAQSDALPAGVYVFADIERLSRRAEVTAAETWTRLHTDPSRWLTLNRPGTTLRRLGLMERLDAAGINRHRAWSLGAAPPQDVRFPVFLRVADDHAGARTSLLNDDAELDAAISRLRRAGTDLRRWIGCEFAGWRRPDGLYAKCAAFRVSNEVLPRGILFSSHWLVKDPDVVNALTLREEEPYVRDNPHADRLARVFDLAGVDYGRIDYSVDAEDRLNVWEINTNPQIHSISLAAQERRRAFNDAWARTIGDRFRALSARVPHEPVAPRLRRRIAWRGWRAQAPRYGATRVERAFWTGVRRARRKVRLSLNRP